MESTKDFDRRGLGAKQDPFPGLRPFEPSDSEFYSGREQQKYQILKSLTEGNFIAIVGGKGIGKTSFINAVVIPELHKGYVVKGNKKWKIAAMRPGRDPLGALASALATIPAEGFDGQSKVDPNLSDRFEEILRSSKMGVIEILEKEGFLSYSNLLISIDHLDDLVLHDEHELSESIEKDIRLFIDRLVECVGQTAYSVSIITSLRSENIGKFSDFLQLAEVINKNQFLLGPLRKSEIIQVLELTVKRGNLQYDQDLIQQINDFFKTNQVIPGQFQHAMMRCVHHWKKGGSIGEIGKDDLDEIGGLEHSIETQLQEIYNAFDLDRKRLCRLCFQALTGYSHLGEVYVLPRRIEDLSEITASNVSEVVEVLHPFISSNCGALRILDSNEIARRLEKLDALSEEGVDLITAKSLVSISQELVLESWSLLREWIDQEREDSLFYLDIGHDVDKGEHPYQGEKLVATMAWYEKRQPHPAWAHRYRANFVLIEDFLNRSKEFHERELAIKEAEEISRKKVKARNRLIVGAFVAGLIVLMVFNFFSGQRAASDREAAKVAWQVAQRKEREAKTSAEKASIEGQKAEMASKQAKLKKDEAKLASQKAIRESKIADSLKLVSDSLNAEFRIKSADLSAAIVKVDESRKLEEYLNILEQVRELSAGAENKILNNPEDQNQLNLAVSIASDAYEKFKETEHPKYLGLADSVKVLKEYRQNKLFSTMNLAYQNVKSFPLLADLDHGMVVDKIKSSVNADGSGEFLIGTSIENSVIKLDIEDGEVTGVLPWTEVADQKELIRGIKDIKLTNSGSHLLISNLPVNQDGRYISLFNSSGKFQIAVNMPSQVENIFRFNKNEFLAIDQKSNVYKLYNIEKNLMDTQRLHSLVKKFKAADYNERLGTMVITHSKKSLVFIRLSPNGDPQEFESITPTEFADDITSIKMVPQHNMYVVGTIKGEMYFYDFKSKQIIYEATDEHANRVNCLEVSADGNVLVSGARDRKVNVWKIPEMLLSVKDKKNVKPFKPIKFTESESVRDVSFVGNKWILVISSNEGFGSSRGGKVSLFTLDFNLTGQELGKLKNKIAAD